MKRRMTIDEREQVTVRVAVILIWASLIIGVLLMYSMATEKTLQEAWAMSNHSKKMLLVLDKELQSLLLMYPGRDAREELTHSKTLVLLCCVDVPPQTLRELHEFGAAKMVVERGVLLPSAGQGDAVRLYGRKVTP